MPEDINITNHIIEKINHINKLIDENQYSLALEENKKLYSEALQLGFLEKSNEIQYIKEQENIIILLMDKNNILEEWPTIKRNINSTSKETLIKIGKDLLDLRHYSDAIIAYEAIEKNFGGDIDTYFILRDCYIAKHDIKKSLEYTQKVLQIDSQNKIAMWLEVNALCVLEDFDNALISIKNMIAIYPDHDNIYYSLGYILSKLGHYQDALDAYMKQYAIQKSEDLYTNLIALALKMNNYELGFRMVNEGLKMSPFNTSILSNKIILLFKNGKYDEAIEVCEYILHKIDPKNEFAYRYKGNALARLGRYQDALQIYAIGLDIHPASAALTYDRACTYAQMGEKDFAINNIKKAIELDSHYLDVAKKDPDFDAIRDTPEFIALVGK